MKVLAFQKRVREGEPKLYYGNFKDTADFGNVLRRDLTLWLNDPERPWHRPAPATPTKTVEAKKPAPPEPPLPDWRHTYPLPKGFTGRMAERQMLTDWWTNGSQALLTLEAIGGMGKSALTWAWVHWDVLGIAVPGYEERVGPEATRVPEEARPEGVLWWSFYEGDASFSSFLKRSLAYLRVGEGLESDYDRAEALRHELETRRVLLILDGFERLLRAYAGQDGAYLKDEDVEKRGEHCTECSESVVARFLTSLAGSTLRGRVLLTSRLLPSVLRDQANARHERLESWADDDIVAYFEGQEIPGSRSEVLGAVREAGGHPLMIHLIAQAILFDPRMRGGVTTLQEGFAKEFLEKLTGKGGRGKHHVLEVLFDAMPSARRELLSRIAVLRSPVEYGAIEALQGELNEAELAGAVKDLEARGLLLYDPTRGRYDLHPIVRGYAYDRLGDKKVAHDQARRHFEKIPPPETVKSIDDLANTIELYQQLVSAGRLDQAWEVFGGRLRGTLSHELGAYRKVTELLEPLFPNGVERPPVLTDQSTHGLAINQLGNAYSFLGDRRLGMVLEQASLEACVEADDPTGAAIAQRNVANTRLAMGQLADAAVDLESALERAERAQSDLALAGTHERRGWLAVIEGRLDEAENDLDRAEAHWTNASDRQWRGIESYRAELFADQGRWEDALEWARKALAVADEGARARHTAPGERLVGEALTGLGRLDEAQPHIETALLWARRTEDLGDEIAALLTQALWLRASEKGSEACDSARQAAELAERCELRLLHADTELLLAELAHDAGDRDGCRRHARKAQERAYCDGPPHYYMSVYDQATALLEAVN